MKKHNRRYAFCIVELPFGSGDWAFVQEGLYRWLMQNRYCRRTLCRMAGIEVMVSREWQKALAKERKRVKKEGATVE